MTPASQRFPVFGVFDGQIISLPLFFSQSVTHSQKSYSPFSSYQFLFTFAGCMLFNSSGVVLRGSISYISPLQFFVHAHKFGGYFSTLASRSPPSLLSTKPASAVYSEPPFEALNLFFFFHPFELESLPKEPPSRLFITCFLLTSSPILTTDPPFCFKVRTVLRAPDWRTPFSVSQVLFL